MVKFEYHNFPSAFSELVKLRERKDDQEEEILTSSHIAFSSFQPLDHKSVLHLTH